MSWTFCTSGAAVYKAGANVNSTVTASGAYLVNLSDEIESIICDVTRYDCITNYASLTANGKQLLASIATAYIASHIINYEPEAIGTTGAALRLNVLYNEISRGFKQLEDKNIKTYLGISS